MKTTVINKLGLLGTALFTLMVTGSSIAQVQIFYRVFDINCNGSNDGLIVVEGMNGVQPYTYLWSNGSTETSLQNIGPGFYSVTITDANSNSAQLTVALGEPAPISINSSVTQVTTPNGNDGSIAISVMGAVGGYDINWSNGETEEYIYNLNAGNYTVEVTDERGCSTTQTIPVNQPTPIFADPYFNANSGLVIGGANNGFTYPNPSNGNVRILLDNAVTYNIYDEKGFMVVDGSKDDCSCDEVNTDLARGNYLVVLIDEFGNKKTEQLIVR